MEPQYWHQKWQSLDIGFNQSDPNKLLQRYFSLLRLPVEAHVFVPLCGQSIDMLWLAKQGYQVIGVELSELACERFFRENNILVQVKKQDNFIVYQSEKITIFVGDFFKLDATFLHKIDAVYDRAALIALPPLLREAYTTHLMKLVHAKTLMFLITTVYQQNEMQGPPFSVNEGEIMKLYGHHFKIEKLYSKSFDVPAHLSEKGLRQAIEQAYLLIPTSQTSMLYSIEQDALHSKLK